MKRQIWMLVLLCGWMAAVQGDVISPQDLNWRRSKEAEAKAKLERDKANMKAFGGTDADREAVAKAHAKRKAAHKKVKGFRDGKPNPPDILPQDRAALAEDALRKLDKKKKANGGEDTPLDRKRREVEDEELKKGKNRNPKPTEKELEDARRRVKEFNEREYERAKEEKKKAEEKHKQLGSRIRRLGSDELLLERYQAVAGKVAAADERLARERLGVVHTTRAVLARRAIKALRQQLLLGERELTRDAIVAICVEQHELDRATADLVAEARTPAEEVPTEPREELAETRVEPVASDRTTLRVSSVAATRVSAKAEATTAPTFLIDLLRR